jgi:hypothetical protein
MSSLSLESDDEEKIQAWRDACREEYGQSFAVPPIDLDDSVGLSNDDEVEDSCSEVEPTAEVLFHVGKEVIRAKRPRSSTSPFTPSGYTPRPTRPRLAR